MTIIREKTQNLLYILLDKRKLRVAAYCRVSKKGGQGSSLEMQIQYFTNYIQENPSWCLVGVYSDASSGLRAKNRIGYNQLIRDCKKGKIDLIVMKSVSRWGRDFLESVRQMRCLRDIGIELNFEIGGINTMNTSNFDYEMLAIIAQAESELKSENIKFGLKQRMKSGKVLLNHTQFLGYGKKTDN